MGLILKNGKSYGGTLPSTAKHLKYDNTNSDISSENVQGAIDELANKTIEGTVSSAQKDGDGNIIAETYLTRTGDSANNITSFTSADSSNPTSYADIDVLGSGEKHSSIFNKLSVVFKNVRYIWKLIGNTDISAIGDGTVTGGISALNANLNGKAPTTHNHTKSQITDFPSSLPASDVYSWAKATSKPSYSWSEITSKPSTFTPASHVHDDRYYTEAEVNNLLAGKVNTSAISTASVGYAGYLRSYSSSGGDHGTGSWLIKCQHNYNGNGKFMFVAGDGSIGTCVDYGVEAGRLPCYNNASYNVAPSSDGFSSWYLDPSKGNVSADNVLDLGKSSRRWKQLFAATATISTSDRNLKDNIKQLSDIHYEFFMKLLPVSFTFKDGESGRTHIGFIAQDVEETMKELGMSSLNFAGFCKDVKTVSIMKDNELIEETVLDENDNPEYIYSLRYEEFIGLITHALQKTIDRLDDIENRLAALESA